MYLENYFGPINRDIAEATAALKASLPETVRRGLEDELRKLEMMLEVLNGKLDKSTVHQLRANLRWARQRLGEAKEPAVKKKMEVEIMQLEQQIKIEDEVKRRG